MNTATNTIRCNEKIENIAKTAIILSRSELEEKAFEIILALSDEKIAEIMEQLYEESA